MKTTTPRRAAGRLAPSRRPASLPAPAIAQGIKEFKMVTDWPPRTCPGCRPAPSDLARSITAMSDGHLKVTVYPAGSLVRAFETFDAVSAGVADMYHTDEAYFEAKSPALIFLPQCRMA